MESTNMDLIQFLLANPLIPLIAVGGTIALVIAIIKSSKWHEVEGEVLTEELKVIDLSFRAHQSHTNVNPAFVNGGVGFTVNTTEDEEENVVVLRGKNFKKIIVDDENFFDSVEEGDTVTVRYTKEFTYHEDKPNDLQFQGVNIKSITVKGEVFSELDIERYNYNDHSPLEAAQSQR
jgi:hypothetical protein